MKGFLKKKTVSEDAGIFFKKIYYFRPQNFPGDGHLGASQRKRLKSKLTKLICMIALMTVSVTGSLLWVGSLTLVLVATTSFGAAHSTK